MPDEMFALGLEAVILTPEGHDPAARVVTRHCHDPIGIEACAVHEHACGEIACSGFDCPTSRGPCEPGDLSVQGHDGPASLDLRREDTADRGIVRYPFLRDQNRSETVNVRLDFSCLIRSEQTEAGQPVRSTSGEHGLEAWAFMGGPRDDQLATDLVVNVMVLAELGHPLDTRSGQAGFCRPRLILKSGVEHTAVVATLVLRQCRFLLQHTNRIDA
jgi:hypothetical protein